MSGTYVETTIYLNGGANVMVIASADDVKRELSSRAIAEFTDTKGHLIHVRRDSVHYWRETES